MTTETKAVLNEIDLRLTQALLASRIGRPKNHTNFLQGEIERIRHIVRDHAAKATRS